MEKPQEELMELLRELKEVVNKMYKLYDDNPQLNDEVDIQKIIPMSLDEWGPEIEGVIEVIEGEDACRYCGREECQKKHECM